MIAARLTVFSKSIPNLFLKYDLFHFPCCTVLLVRFRPPLLLFRLISQLSGALPAIGIYKLNQILLMKKTYSHKFFKEENLSPIPRKNNVSNQKPNKTSATRKPFVRKPVNSYIPMVKKREKQSDKVFNQTSDSNFSALLERSKKIKFVSTRSNISLNSYKQNPSNASFSMLESQQADAHDDSLGCMLESSQNTPSRSNQSSVIRHKNLNSVHTPIANKAKKGADLRMVESIYCHEDKTEKEQTRLQSTQLSQTRSFNVSTFPAMNSVLVENTKLSKVNSRESLRKSNSSNSLRKRQNQNCSSCIFFQKESSEFKEQILKLEKFIEQKDARQKQLEEKIRILQKRSRSIDRKQQELENSYSQKIKRLTEELSLSNEECHRWKEQLAKTNEELKYKNVEITTLKKWKAQYEGLERKCQMLSTERNDLRQKLSKQKVKPVRNSLLGGGSASKFSSYPTISKRNAVQAGKGSRRERIRSTLTSRNEQEDYNAQSLQNEDNIDQLDLDCESVALSGFKKKKENAVYEESQSSSSIMSFSSESNF